MKLVLLKMCSLHYEHQMLIVSGKKATVVLFCIHSLMPIESSTHCTFIFRKLSGIEQTGVSYLLSEDVMINVQVYVPSLRLVEFPKKSKH